MEKIPEKKCNSCGIIHPVYQFTRDKSSRDGLVSSCKDCTKKRTKPRLNEIISKNLPKGNFRF